MFARAGSTVALLIRHANAYGELIGEDFGLAYCAFLRRFWAGVALTAAGAFAIALACVWVIALTWGTPARLWVIAGLFGLFVLASAASLLVLRSPRNAPRDLLARTRLEWQKDRLLLDELLARPDGNRG